MSEIPQWAAVAGMALALSACGEEPIKPYDNPDRGVLRVMLAQDCLAHIPAGPVKTQYNDWDDVVNQCDENAYYQANGCSNPKLCIAALQRARAGT